MYSTNPFTPPEKAKFSLDRKSTRLNSSHRTISYAVFCLKKKMHCRSAADDNVLTASRAPWVLRALQASPLHPLPAAAPDPPDPFQRRPSPAVHLRPPPPF